MKQQRKCIPDPLTRAAWRGQLIKTGSDPTTGQHTADQEGESLSPLAEYYRKRPTLPRLARLTPQRAWRRSLVGVALLCALNTNSALAATINVSGTCTLVKAITSANTDKAGSGCAKGSGADTIVLPANSVQTLTAVNNTAPYGPTALPVIGGVLTINGNGGTIKRAPSAPKFRFLAVAITGKLTLQNVTLSGGFAPKVTGNNSANDGGAVLNLGGGLTVANSTITGNTADRGGGVASQGAPPSFARVNLIITNSTISGNTAVAGSEPTSGWGGGVDIDPYTNLTVTNSTISSNSAAGYGGGVYAITGSVITITNSTMTGNSSGKRAGGIATGCATLKLTRNLIAGNTAPIAAEMSTASAGCQVADLSYNLFGHSKLTNAQAFFIFAPGVTDLTATSNGNTPTALAGILKTTLGSNGGRTKTNALVATSPAVDAVTDGTCPPPATDQRGVSRPQDGNGDGGPACDIGSYELVAGTQPPPTTATCNGLTATIVGTAAGETLNGTEGADVIQGLGGADLITSLGGNDVICGGPGNDSMYAGPGNDQLFGEQDDDQLIGVDGDDLLDGGDGLDRLDGRVGTDTCNGGPPATGDTAVNCEQTTGVP